MDRGRGEAGTGGRREHPARHVGTAVLLPTGLLWACLGG
jgi:hypothetical protein